MSEFKNEGPGVYEHSHGGTCTVYRVSKGAHPKLVGVIDDFDTPHDWFAISGRSWCGNTWPSLIRRIGPLTLPEQIEDKPLQLEVGKRYMRRDGRVTNPLFDRIDPVYRFGDDYRSWDPGGRWSVSKGPTPYDIIRRATPEEIAEADGVAAPTEPVYGWQCWDTVLKQWRPPQDNRYMTEAEAESAAVKALLPNQVFRTFRVADHSPKKQVRSRYTKTRIAVPYEESNQ